MAKLLQISPPELETAGGGFALWRLGFRPFYLLASVFAALSAPLWAAQYAGWLPIGYAAGAAGHAHEMIFGFAMAVIVGFLLTAVRNWAERPTPTGAWLAAIVALWAVGRVVAFMPAGWFAALVNAAFPIAAAIGIGIPIAKSRNKRNYFFVALMLVMAAASLVVQLALLGTVDLPAGLGLQVGLDVILFVMAVMGGRVIPMFTNNGVPGTKARRTPLLEKLSLGGVLVLVAADTLMLRGTALAVLLVAVAAAHAARWWLWQPWRTLKTPLVWVLHAAYAWIPIHLLLRALGEFGLVAAPLATHALTLGAIGGLTIGMMTRTARGHTGRILQADRSEVACYLLVLAAALVRVFGPPLFASLYRETVIASAVLWSAGYALYAIRYWPVLTRPRIDGKPG
jgi:uncharacterized protein involved in response to NO